MAFDVKKILGGRENVPETLYLPAKGGESYAAGEALILSEGALTLASGDLAVSYIALESYEAPESGARALAVFRVLPGMVFEVPASATSSSVQIPGAFVTIGSDGLTVTATAATKGGAEILSADGDRLTVFLK